MSLFGFYVCRLMPRIVKPIGGSVGEVIGRGVLEGVRLEAEGAADAAGAAVAGGEDVDVGVADHDGF